MPVRYDGIYDDRRCMLAPDLMAANCLYMILYQYGLTWVVVSWQIFDLLYYGPLGLAMSFSFFLFFYIFKK